MAETQAASSRDKILDVAEALFARSGFAGVGLREVARSVGLGKSSLFHHFRSKTALYLAVLERVFGRIEERLAPVYQSVGEPAERLDRILDAVIDALAEHPTTARLLLRGLFEDDDYAAEDAAQAEVVEQLLQRILGGLRRVIEEGAASGVFRQASAAHTIQTVIGALVYHFASGEFGERLIGAPLLSAEAVRRRKEEVKNLLHHGLLTAP